MKKVFMCLAAAALSMTMAVPSLAITRGTIVDSGTYVPLRGAFKELNFKINWDSTARKAYLDDGLNKVVIPVDEDYVTVNDEVRELEKPVINIDGSIYLPLRAVSNLIGATVDWDGEAKIVSIKYNGYISIVSCDEDSYFGGFNTYDEFPNVPNFGVIHGVELIDKSVGENTAVYKYYIDQKGIENSDNPEVILGDIIGYLAMQELYGFKDDEDASSDTKIVYKNDSLSETVTLVSDEAASTVTLTITKK